MTAHLAPSISGNHSVTGSPRAQVHRRPSQSETLSYVGLPDDKAVPKSAYVPVTVKLKRSGIAAIDAIAEAEELTRTDVIRRLLRVGLDDHNRKTRGRP